MKKLPKGADFKPKKAAVPAWTATEHESAFLKSFVVGERRERMALLFQPSRRDMHNELAHFKWFDERRISPIEPNDQHPDHIARLLKAKGAPDIGYVISEYRELDGTFMELNAALEATVGHGVGSIISCIPGRLAFYEGEMPEERFILIKPT